MSFFALIISRPMRKKSANSSVCFSLKFLLFLSLLIGLIHFTVIFEMEVVSLKILVLFRETRTVYSKERLVFTLKE